MSDNTGFDMDDDFDPSDAAEELSDNAVQTVPGEAGDKLKKLPKGKVEKCFNMLKDWMVAERRLFELVEALEELIPKPEPTRKYATEEQLRRQHIGDGPDSPKFVLSDRINPGNISMVMFNEMFNDRDRYEQQDPALLPLALETDTKIERAQPDFSNITLGSHSATVPDAADLWLTDKSTGFKFTVTYGPTHGGFAVAIRCKKTEKDQAVALLSVMKEAVSCCKYIKGEVLEVYAGGFKVLEGIGEQQFPVIDKFLQGELEKNVTNMFSKAQEFRDYVLPVKRSIILQGSPGCGKTMICRWLAKNLKGQVTVFWVTAKSIQSQVDVSMVFEMARKLSPSMIVMEDMDLISGTRATMLQQGNGALGELLNQLDGLDPNESLVVVATTNEVNSLDKALNDRPGRFDRIYKVALPDSEIAENIAKNFLRARKISEEVIADIDYGPVSGGNLTGAQVVEVMKGAIFEAVHARGDVNTLCVKRSAKGLEDQRRMLGLLDQA